MRPARFLVSILIAALAGCGGGGGGSDPTPPPPPPPPTSQALTITLAGTGSMPGFFESVVLSGFQLANSLAEYDALYFGRPGPNKPLELRALDFTQFSVLYVEGPADDFLGAVVRLVDIRRTGGTLDKVTGERCTNDILGIPTPSRAYRSYAFYIVPKLSVSTSYAWTSSVNACATVTPVGVTRVAVSDEVPGGRLPPFMLLRAIRTQADLDAVLPSFPPGVVPPQYRAPDFSQVTLLFVTSQGDWDVNSYVRVDRVYKNDDGSRDVIAEYCGNGNEGIPTHVPFALYTMPRFDEAARLVLIEHQPGSCILSR